MKYISYWKYFSLESVESRIIVHTLETHEGCTHEVAVPPDHEYVPLTAVSGPPAKVYKFILDPFQREAILCIDNNQSVLVSAHTSAGKTVCAEWVKILQELKVSYPNIIFHT